MRFISRGALGHLFMIGRLLEPGVDVQQACQVWVRAGGPVRGDCCM
jgi:hypothetical protein